MILMYHKVDIVTPTHWWVTPEDLARQLRAVGREREFVHLDDYVSPATQAVVTFDDAYENVARHGLPVLSSLAVPFEVFVVGDLIGDWNDADTKEPPTRYMGYRDLEDVIASGGRLQWHSKTHALLPGLDVRRLDAELTVPAELRARFGAPNFGWFSYPFGAHDKAAVDMARERFRGAVSVLEGEFGDRWQLNRVTVDRHTQF